MKKNFYHKIGVAELLAEVVKTPEEDRSQWILDFALDLVDDNERKCKTPFAKELIARTKSGRKKQASDGAKGGKKKAENLRKNKDISSHPTESASVTIASSRSSSSNRSSSKDLKTFCASTDDALHQFDTFWNVFNYKKGKGGALKSWNQIKLTEHLFNTILNGAAREAQNRPIIISKGNTPKMAQGWLTEKRWEDEHEETTAKTEPKTLSQQMDESREQRHGMDKGLDGEESKVIDVTPVSVFTEDRYRLPGVN
jgi:hypothetical protein